MGSSCYDIGLPMDLQESLGKLAEKLGAKIPEVAHALMRDALSRFTANEARMTAIGYDSIVKQWWTTVGECKKK